MQGQALIKKAKTMSLQQRYSARWAHRWEAKPGLRSAGTALMQEKSGVKKLTTPRNGLGVCYSPTGQGVVPRPMLGLLRWLTGKLGAGFSSAWYSCVGTRETRRVHRVCTTPNHSACNKQDSLVKAAGGNGRRPRSFLRAFAVHINTESSSPGVKTGLLTTRI